MTPPFCSLFFCSTSSSPVVFTGNNISRTEHRERRQEYQGQQGVSSLQGACGSDYSAGAALMARHASMMSTLAEATIEGAMSGINGMGVVVELQCMRGYAGTVAACCGVVAWRLVWTTVATGRVFKLMWLNSDIGSSNKDCWWRHIIFTAVLFTVMWRPRPMLQRRGFTVAATRLLGWSGATSHCSIVRHGRLHGRRQLLFLDTR